MSSGATFEWTFDQPFAGNVAPPADTTGVSRRGVERTGVTQDGVTATDLSHQ